ncbi:PfEMP1 [Plasmodium falciparum Dd2]|uniref:PfEMP1 n=2 Tax=Plasmodium falciparum TaxID=5833 RepID=A0A0L7LXY3_PLAF4|nr:PfEMP1 [Plasmodium falciparum Dd2]
MGSQTSKFSKTVVGNETHNSARNVLEKFALEIKNKASDDAKKYRSSLKGYLSQAKFYHPFSEHRRYYTGPCELDYAFHSNTPGNRREFRHPCAGRNKTRFSNEGEAECNSSRITGNKTEHGACAPYRRRHMCDLNLEHIDVHNTKNSNDLLGNILVTAKYEGESIVKNHPNRGSSEVCIALARSFADIGDIIRGRDMFLGNNETDKEQKVKLEKNLKNIFKKIYEELREEQTKRKGAKPKNGRAQIEARYKKDDDNYYQLREDWWALNREDVWKALTCSADGSEDYFIKSSDKEQSFSNEYCGHRQGSVPTNFDYVPQFLRWFTEWAEEFCRIKNIKIEHVTKTCTGESNNKHCSREGYDCKRTDLKKNEIFVDLECPNCEKACTSYNEWLKKKEGEFNKQKKKYEKEIENNQSNSHSTYDNELYNNLKTNYSSFENFVETLKEGAYCTNGIIEGKIDFNKQYDTFSHSQYCKSCPILGVKCENGQCNSLDDIKCTYGNEIPNRVTDKNNDIFIIDILLNDNKKKVLSNDLPDFKKCDLFKRLRRQNWNCKYKCNLHVCEQKNYNNEIDDERVISIKVFIKRWLESFLKDYNKLKENLNPCINSEKKQLLCIKDCYKNCDCVEKWITKKRDEWKSIKERYIEQYESKDEVFSSKLKTFLKQGLFPEYIKNALNKGETLDNMNESDGCNVPNNSKGKPCNNNDVINILLNRLKKKIETCKTQHDENKNNNSCKTLPPPPRRRLRSGRQVVRRSVQVVKRRRSDRHFVEVTKPVNGEGEEANGDTTVELPGPSVTPVPELPGPPATTPGVKPAPPAKVPSACEIVKVIFKGKSATDDIEGCRPKKDYKPWNCTSSQFKSGHTGACMPPRRQKLCVINLKTFEPKTSDELRNAFIKCAAIETHFLWKYYKEKNNVKNDKILESGYIPEDFKRMMYYTFGDYRDLCLDKNIGNDVSVVENNIKGVLTDSTKNGGTEITPDNWWKTIEKEVWDGMLCALSYNSKERSFKEDVRTQLTTTYGYSKIKFSDKSTTLEKFAQTPQFLRWMIEWGEDFCKKRKEKVDKLVEQCRGCDVSTDGSCERDVDGCKKCRDECTKYQKWLETWKGHYEKQKKKYKDDKKSYENDLDANNSEEAYQYLNKKLKKICQSDSTNGDCEYNCMGKNSTQSPDNTHMPASLDDEPEEVEGRCTCQKAPQPSAESDHKHEDSKDELVPKKTEVPKEVENPCANPSGIKHPVLATKVAHQMQQKAHQKMIENSVKNSEIGKGKSGESKSSLIGNIKNATFRNGRNPSRLTEEVCDITDNHTNDRRHGTKAYNGPCTGKDKVKNGFRLKIGTEWQTGEGIKISDPHLYLPPRRQHICTSNLEKINVDKVTGNGNVNDTFLVDVLLAAKMDAAKIKNVYKEQNGKSELTEENDKATVCRAIRYSFADIGDIIKGTDSWVNNRGEQTTQRNLVTIFDKIKTELEDNLNGKYATDDPKHTKLRADWWEANREEVWKAMKCSLKDVNTSEGDCIYKSRDRVPVDDYIPQRLRWMTEWAEWYCKEQSRLYGELEKECKECRSGKCDKGCEECKSKCKEYEQLVEKWEKQWRLISDKYKKLYEKAERAANGGDTSSGTGDTKDENDVVSFLKQLHDKNSDHKIYSTAAGYIHQEAHISDCKKQTLFCKNPSGSISSGTNNDQYAFRTQPHDHDDACKCKDRPPQTEDGRARLDRGEDGPLPPPKESLARSAGPSPRPPPPAQQPPPPQPAHKGGVARILLGRTANQDDEEEEEDADVEVEAEGVSNHQEDEGSPKEEVETAKKEGSSSPKEEVEKVNPCEIVKELFKDTSKFSDACGLKYGKNYGWKCVTPSGDKTDTGERAVRVARQTSESGETSGPSSSSGAICVPPRRRRLYIGKIKDWADTVETQTSGKESSQSDNKLRTAFIESAAIETFFLWHRYKKENKPQGVGSLPLQPPQLTVSGSGEQNPETSLKSGTIPPEFLRQMFYTLGDYRDICVGVKDNDVIEALKKSVYKDSSGEEKSKMTTNEISTKIKEFLQKQNSDTSSGPSRGGPASPSSKDPESWWNKHAESIWKGMVCALTYKEASGSDGEKKIEKDDDVYEKIFGKPPNNDNPQNSNNKLNPVTNGTYEKDYKYETVSFGASGTGAKSNDDTKLENFVVRPTYFRYLEEWGQNFCKERKKRLEKIEEECKVEENGGGSSHGGNEKKPKCSCDGESCEDMFSKKYDIISSFLCLDCGKSCRSYRKWIDIKKTEFQKQKRAYGQQKEKAKSSSDPQFVTELENYGSIDLFLQKLGRFSNNNSGCSNIKFDENGDTFKPAKNCKPCSKFKIDCQKGNCDNSKGNNCNGKKVITASNIENEGISIGNVDMLVSDDSATEFKDGLSECKDKGIFKGIRKDIWKCRNVCGYVVCKPENFNDGTYAKVYIQIRELIKRWLEYFFDDYKKIKHKISHCINSGNKSTCTNDCPNKCKCVRKWIEEKKNEWKTLKERFNGQYKSETSGDYPVRSFLEELIPQIPVANAKNKVIKLSEFDNSCGCNAKASSTNGKNEDAIECMLDKLGERATSCQKQHSDKTEQQCKESSTHLEDEEPLEETEDVKAPNICPVLPKPQAEKEDGCKTDAPQPDVKEKEEEKEEENDKGDEEQEEEEEEEDDEEDEEDEEEEEESSDENHDDDSDYETEDEDQDELDTAGPLSPSESQPKRLPREFPSPELKNAMLFSTILCMVGIGFAAFTYFFLKKKPKSPVDLIRVLDIHKGDYGIPTSKSSNRYIPYVSDTYKGKTYIYMEGDSDSGHYYEDTTDITSSESEYEEMDINDIYVPGSPKYKTLIEVVLEPSKRDTPSSDTPMNKFTDEEWNELKHDFISQYIQSRLPMDVPQYDVSTELPMNIVGNVLDDGMDEKPFITSIHDRDLYTGEEISYNIHMSTNIMDDTSYVSNNVYSGIDLINDTLSRNKHIDIYDEVLKRKENELYGTNYKKNTSNNNVAKLTNSDPIMNQLDLLHRWLDRHRDMCEKWNKKEELLEKLNEEWNKDNDGGNVTNDNKRLNTDVSIQIDMDETKGKKEFSNMDTNVDTPTMDNILDDLETYNEPFYDIYEDDIYYDVNDENPSVNDIPMDHNKVDVPKKVHVEMKIHNNTSNGSLEQEFPISDVWNI